MKIKVYILAVSFLFPLGICSSENQNFPAPYSELKELLPFNDHGWYNNGHFIERLMKENKVANVIEIGSWLGCSTRHIGSLVQPGGKVYAVDTWEGSIEHHQNHHWASMLPSLYNQFLSNIIHVNLMDVVVPIRMRSLDAVDILKNVIPNPDLVYIDAAHDTDSVLKDLEAYWPFVQERQAILCGDDWNWDTVRAAVEQFAQKNNLTIYAKHHFWFLKEEAGYQIQDLHSVSAQAWIFNSLQ